MGGSDARVRAQAHTRHGSLCLHCLQVHLNFPYLGALCRKLGVDYAAALTGFDIRAGRRQASQPAWAACLLVCRGAALPVPRPHC